MDYVIECIFLFLIIYNEQQFLTISVAMWMEPMQFEDYKSVPLVSISDNYVWGMV